MTSHPTHSLIGISPLSAPPGGIAHQPAMPQLGPPQWSAARWVGSIADSVPADTTVQLAAAVGYRRARLLVRTRQQVRGFVDVAVTASRVDGRELAARIAQLPPAPPQCEPAAWPSITVVVCTRDRPQQLRQVLTSLLQLDYPTFNILVVNNAARTSETATMVHEEFADPRLAIVSEPRPGLSHARNTGLAHATGEIVAFTDDDVSADIFWLQALARGFSRAPGIDCVTGLVPSGELRTPVQTYFDHHTSWSKNLTPRLFSLAQPPSDLPLFPFCVGRYGTGANFAVRRDTACELGGFDTNLGVGTRSGGGEDIDFFTRLIIAGGTLVTQPSAVIWHRHRSDPAALRTQAVGYGRGLGAWLTKIACHRPTLQMALRRSPQALRWLVLMPWRTHTSPATEPDLGADLDHVVTRAAWIEWFSIATGPWHYWQQHRITHQYRKHSR